MRCTQADMEIYIHKSLEKHTKEKGVDLMQVTPWNFPDLAPVEHWIVSLLLKPSNTWV